MKTEAAFYKNLAFALIFEKPAVPLSLKGIPPNSVEFREVPSNSTSKSTQVVDLKVRLSEFCCGIFTRNFSEVYISA